MDTSFGSAREGTRKTFCVVRAVFSWWVVAPAVWLVSFVAALVQDDHWLGALAGASFLAVTVGLGVSLAVHLLCLGLLRLIGGADGEGGPCPHCGSRRIGGNFCARCGSKLRSRSSNPSPLADEAMSICGRSAAPTGVPARPNDPSAGAGYRNQAGQRSLGR